MSLSVLGGSDVFYLLYSSLLLLFLGSLLPFASKRDRCVLFLAYVPAILSSILLLSFSIYSLINGISIETGGIFIQGEKFFSVKIDPLSSFFLVCISLVYIFVSIYSIDYNRIFSKKYDIRVFSSFINLLDLTMIMLLLSNDVLSFMFYWELMTLISYFLIVYNHTDGSTRRAGMLYFIFAHLGGLLVLLSFAVLFINSRSLSFDYFQRFSSYLPQIEASLAFILAFFGFGIKAGMVPLHAWLPEAYTVASSNTVAILSGAMEKMAIYGIIRFALFFLPIGRMSAIGAFAVAMGLITAITGIFLASVQSDLKRFLAYSTIENMGIIILGIGLTILFSSYGLASAATIALVATLYQTLNHSLAKSLLFLGTGTVTNIFNTRNIDQLGGLSKYLPVTTWTFFIASWCIAAIPPFGCFASEWLLYQSLMFSAWSAQSFVVSIISILSVLVIAIVGAVAVMAYIKTFGIGFLGYSKFELKEKPKESYAIKLSLIPLSAFCITMGIFVPQVVDLLKIPTIQALPFSYANAIHTSALILSFPLWNEATSISFPMYTLVLLIMVSIPTVVITKVGKRIWRLGKTWVSGTEAIPPVHSSSFVQPLRRNLSNIFGIREEVEREGGFFGAYKIAVRILINPPIEKYAQVTLKIPAYNDPIDKLVTIVPSAFKKLANIAKNIQSGSVITYILYILLTFIVLITIAVVSIP
ncbi:MAG: proton-conducting transporter membrane subunit [Fervidicoccus sp.]